MSTGLASIAHEPRIAHFSREIAPRSAIPIYSGGMSVLAGDNLGSAAGLDLPMTGETLISRVRAALLALELLRRPGAIAKQPAAPRFALTCPGCARVACPRRYELSPSNGQARCDV